MTCLEGRSIGFAEPVSVFDSLKSALCWDLFPLASFGSLASPLALIVFSLPLFRQSKQTFLITYSLGVFSLPILSSLLLSTLYFVLHW